MSKSMKSSKPALKPAKRVDRKIKTTGTTHEAISVYRKQRDAFMEDMKEHIAGKTLTLEQKQKLLKKLKSIVARLSEARKAYRAEIEAKKKKAA